MYWQPIKSLCLVTLVGAVFPAANNALGQQIDYPGNLPLPASQPVIGVTADSDAAVAPLPQGLLPYAGQSLELTRAGYEQSKFNYLQLVTAQQTFSRTNLAYIERLRELWLASVRIDGMLVTGGLNAPGQSRAIAGPL